VVRDTVAEAAGNVAGFEVCDWAQTSVAVANSKARVRFFTVFSNLGEIEEFLIPYMVRDVCRNEKDGKDWDFGNCPRNLGLTGEGGFAQAGEAAVLA
jgi:hypothetical protein